MVTAVQYVAQGVRAHEAGQIAQALVHYAAALTLEPENFDALHMRGIGLHQLGRTQEGLPLLEAARRIRPQDATALSNCGLALRAVGRFEDALKTYDQCLTVAPQFAQAWSNRGNLLRDLNRQADAIASYEAALQAQPGYARAWHGIGLAQGSLGQWPLAVSAFDAALALQPDFADAYLDRGNALREVGRLDAALASYEQALQYQPENAGAWSNRGVVLKRLGRLEEAAHSYEKSLALNPKFLDAMVNYATLLKEQLRLSASEDMNQRVLAVDPGNSGAHLNLSICLLLRGAFREGFAEYEWRWKNAQMADGARNFAQPQWAGEDIRGKTILLHAEQGLGDTLQFCRYAPWVTARGARVVLEVQPALLELLRCLPGVDTLLPRGAPLPAFDVHCPLLSLPRVMGTDLHTIPVLSAPRWAYVQADATKLAQWQARLGGAAAGARPLRVGLVWSGRPEHKNDHNRSIPLAQFCGAIPEWLGNGRKIELHALQKEFRDADLAWARAHGRVQLWSERLESFADTAALVECMDLVVAVDTSVAHLAAAMGKPVWLLLPFSPDWRWLLSDATSSRWYPSMRLWRQPAYGDWAMVLQDLASAALDLDA